ncbi:MAG: hypothetical protein GXZ09_09635 [Syntrophomonadaceae bacterium]|nr:hypothetical protein [Syntrophomonadaceae bacterium]
MLWLLAQIKPFVLTLLVGLITGMVFQFYQYSMALSSCSRWLLYMFDFLVWVLILLLVFALLLIINQGEIRIYIILALFGGILLYFQTIAPKTQPLIRRAAKTSVYGIRAMAGKAALPWRWLKKQALSWAEQMRKKMEGDEEEE